MPLNVLQRLPEGSRVSVIRLRSLGDCVLTTPAIALLKTFRPDLVLSVVVEESFAAVFSNNPAIDVILPPSPLVLARWRPLLAINFHGGSTSSQLMFGSRARFRAGFEHFRFRALYNVPIPRAQDILGVERKVHTAEHLASAMFYLGVPTQEVPRARLVCARSWQEVPRQPYAVIHPLASAADKTWPAENFRAAAGHLRHELGLKPVFIAGPGESLEEFGEFSCVSGASLEQIKDLISRSVVFLGNDSGPAHMAAAFGKPVVVLFGSSDPIVWAPWKTESQAFIPRADSASIGSIPVTEVCAALARLSVAHTR